MEEAVPFDRLAQFLSQESRRVLDLSRAEAETLKHNFIGTEHQLWGLASEGSLSSFLTPLGITPERVHAGIVFIYDHQAHVNQSAIQPQPANVSSETFEMLTPRAKQVIVLASEEAKSQGEKAVRPAHFLLGLLNEGSGLGAGLLRSLGVSLLQARAALTPPEANQTCSFCGRTASQVKRLFPAITSVGGSEPSVRICDQCVEHLHSILQA